MLYSLGRNPKYFETHITVVHTPQDRALSLYSNAVRKCLREKAGTNYY